MTSFYIKGLCTFQQQLYPATTASGLQVRRPQCNAGVISYSRNSNSSYHTLWGYFWIWAAGSNESFYFSEKLCTVVVVLCWRCAVVTFLVEFVFPSCLSIKVPQFSGHFFVLWDSLCVRRQISVHSRVPSRSCVMLHNVKYRILGLYFFLTVTTQMMQHTLARFLFILCSGSFVVDLCIGG